MSDLDPSGASGAAPPLKRSTLPLPVAAPAARRADSSEAAAPAAGTLAVAAAVAAGSDWIWVSDPSLWLAQHRLGRGIHINGAHLL